MYPYRTFRLSFPLGWYYDLFDTCSEIAGLPAISGISPVISEKIIMRFSKITGDISEIAGDPFVLARVRM
jgi:hypothetical protein